MAEEATTASGVEEEITLVDLIAVLLRRRRLILVGLFCSTLLGLGFAFVPRIMAPSQRSGTVFALELTPLLSPMLKNEPASIDTTLLAFSYAQEPDFFMKSLRDKGIVLDTPPSFALETVQRGSKLHLLIKAKVYEDNNGPAVLKAIHESLDGRVQRILLDMQLIQVPIPVFASPGGVSNISKGMRDAASHGALVFLAGAFITILIAFLVEYIQNLRQDPSSMAKIRSALG